MILSTFLDSCPSDSNKSPAVSSFCFKSFLSFSWVILYSAISLACFSFSTTWKGSPAFGTLFKPNTSTAADGPANLILEPSLFTILLILPIEFPEATKSPTFNVPFWIKKVATEPLNLSNSDSITTPWAGPLWWAFNSSNSASRETHSNNLSTPVPFKAETGTICVVPPQSSGVKSLAAKSPLTLSISAPSKSILFIATTIDTPAALAWLIASSVCGLIPSLAATTKITISVVLAPLALIDEKAAWPGVSIKVILPFGVSTS